MGVGFHFVISGVSRVKIDRCPARVKGNALSVADHDARLTGGICLVWGIIQLETIVTDLIGVDEAMVEAIAKK